MAWWLHLPSWEGQRGKHGDSETPLNSGHTPSKCCNVLLGNGLGGAGRRALPGRILPFTLEIQTSGQQSGRTAGVSGWPDRAALSRQMAEVEAEAVQLKEEGNRHFQLQDYKAATKSYSQALKLTKDKALKATLYRNRAACGLKTVSGRAGGCGPGWGVGVWRQAASLS